MTTTTTATLILFTALFVTSTLAREYRQPPKKHVHKDFQTFEPIISDISEEGYLEGERMLNGKKVIKPKPMRIAVDYEHWVNETYFGPYLQNELIPTVISYLQAALKVRNPLTTNIVSTSPSMCGFSTPKILSTGGVAADMFVFFNNADEPYDSWMGATTICALSSGVKRPMIVNIGVNVPFFGVPDLSSPLNHDLNINLLIHEFIHALGLNGAVYSFFVDTNGNYLQQPVKTVMLSGENRTVLDLPPLTTRLRNFYGCPTIPGLFIENDGTSHPENRFFQWDVMASGDLIGSKITQFNLALLEGTGWYVPDYTYAEPYFFGQNEGCGFYANGTAASNYTAEYCSGTGIGCSTTGETGGYCVSTWALEDYRVITGQPLFNCENPSGVYYVPFSYAQVYGRGLGSKCFTGNLTTYSSAPQASYCLTYNCSTSGVLQVNWGQNTLNCTQAGPMQVNGFLGNFNCPDPKKFCSTIGQPTCRRNCNGRGTCVAGKCVCNAGFIGSDCGFSSSYIAAATAAAAASTGSR